MTYLAAPRSYQERVMVQYEGLRESLQAVPPIPEPAARAITVAATAEHTHTHVHTHTHTHKQQEPMGHQHLQPSDR